LVHGPLPIPDRAQFMTRLKGSGKPFLSLTQSLKDTSLSRKEVRCVPLLSNVPGTPFFSQNFGIFFPPGLVCELGFYPASPLPKKTWLFPIIPTVFSFPQADSDLFLEFPLFLLLPLPPRAQLFCLRGPQHLCTQPSGATMA